MKSKNILEKLYDYQLKAVEATDKNKKGIVCMPTGTGKTFVQASVIAKEILKTNLEFDQLIREFDSWVHISIPNKFADKPRKQVLIIDKAGTRPY